MAIAEELICLRHVCVCCAGRKEKNIYEDLVDEINGIHFHRLVFWVILPVVTRSIPFRIGASHVCSMVGGCFFPHPPPRSLWSYIFMIIRWISMGCAKLCGLFGGCERCTRWNSWHAERHRLGMIVILFNELAICATAAYAEWPRRCTDNFLFQFPRFESLGVILRS